MLGRSPIAVVIVCSMWKTSEFECTTLVWTESFLFFWKLRNKNLKRGFLIFILLIVGSWWGDKHTPISYFLERISYFKKNKLLTWWKNAAHHKNPITKQKSCGCLAQGQSMNQWTREMQRSCKVVVVRYVVWCDWSWERGANRVVKNPVVDDKGDAERA